MANKKLVLEKGKRYQVHNYAEGWIIAEYAGRIDAHTARGLNIKGQTTWKEPATDHFKYVSGGRFAIYSKDLQVRELSAESAEVIARLEANVQSTRKLYQEACAELRGFCQ